MLNKEYGLSAIFRRGNNFQRKIQKEKKKENNVLMITWEDVLNKTVEWRSLKKLSRITTMPASIRAELWERLLDIKDVRLHLDKNPVKILESHEDFVTIDNDVVRTSIPNYSDGTSPNILYNPEKFEKDLCYVLKKFASTFPDFGYIQGINEIVAIFLVVFNDKELSYYGICSVYVKFRMKLIWKIENLIKIVQPSLERKLQERVPRILKKMKKLNIQLIDFTPGFCIPLFLQMNLKFQNKLQILDWFFIGGIKVIRNMIVGLIRMKKSKLLKTNNVVEFMNEIYTFEGDIEMVSGFSDIFDGCKNIHKEANGLNIVHKLGIDTNLSKYEKDNEPTIGPLVDIFIMSGDLEGAHNQGI